MSDHRDSRLESISAELAHFNCDREPIHIPGAIQPHGALLAASADLGLVTHASQNMSTILGRPAAEMLGKPLREAIGEAACLALQFTRSDGGDQASHSFSCRGRMALPCTCDPTNPDSGFASISSRSALEARIRCR